MDHARMDFPRTTLVEPPRAVSAASQIRGTMLTTSYELARSAGLEERYRQLVSPEFRAELPIAAALEWYPMALALAHYRVMDALFPDREEQIRNGRRASEVTQNNHLRVLARGLASSGQVTPVTLLKRAPQVFGRLVQGGGIGAWQTGPKDARLELHGFALLSLPYVRHAWQGMLEGGLGLFARRCYLNEDVRFGDIHRIAWKISWA